MPTSIGQALARDYVRMFFPVDKLIENHRPEWLEGLELDLHWPSLKVAIEFNGIQHYLETFEGHSVARQKKNDRRKARLAKRRHIAFFCLSVYDLRPDRMWRRMNKIGTVMHLKGGVARIPTVDEIHAWNLKARAYFMACKKADPMSVWPGRRLARAR